VINATTCVQTASFHHLYIYTLIMLRQEQGDDIDYEVSQEQLDAVDRMLEELDMEEQLGRGK